MILRDPNHPCAILWSVGNEVPKGVDESESPIETQLSDQVHRLDPTRPVREAIRAPWDRQPRSVARNVFSFLDLGGYNDKVAQYENDHDKCPNRLSVGTESFFRDLAQC